MRAATISKNKIKHSKADHAFNIVNYLVFGLITLICAYPFYYLIINSISANDLSNNGLINFLPRQIHFQNYKDVLKMSGIGTAACLRWKNCNRNRMYRYGICLSRIHVHTGKNVA